MSPLWEPKTRLWDLSHHLPYAHGGAGRGDRRNSTVHKKSSSLHLLEPLTAKTAEKISLDSPLTQPAVLAALCPT